MAIQRRYYRIGGMTLQVESDLSFSSSTYIDALDLFRVDGSSGESVSICLHFQLPDLNGQDLGKEIYRKAPWAIYQKENEWIYLGILSEKNNQDLFCVATFNSEHTHGQIYYQNAESWLRGGLHSLSLLPTDQIIIARLLADRSGCYLHSAGLILDGSGLLFVGHSEAGKSTITKMVQDAGMQSHAGHVPQVEILSDDRNIVRRWVTPFPIASPVINSSGLSAYSAVNTSNASTHAQTGGQEQDGWRVYGTWNHSAIPIVSPSSAPLRAVFFLEQASENTLTLLTDRKEIIRRLLGRVIRPFVTAEWWNKTLDLLAQMAREVPFYILRFDKSGAIVDELVALAGQQ
jgi:hypothetical protein